MPGSTTCYVSQLVAEFVGLKIWERVFDKERLGRSLSFCDNATGLRPQHVVSNYF